jgi:hypothetical protein
MRNMDGMTPIVYGALAGSGQELADYCSPEAGVRERLAARDAEREIEKCRRMRRSRVYAGLMSLVGKGKGDLR